MDGIAKITEFPLIFGHDIAFHELFVMMQIIRAEQKLPATFLHFFQREIKKAAVICFEFHKTVISQNLFVTGEKFPGGESSSCMTFLWPGIGKIQVDPVYLTFSENLRKICPVNCRKERLLKKMQAEKTRKKRAGRNRRVRKEGSFRSFIRSSEWIFSTIL